MPGGLSSERKPEQFLTDLARQRDVSPLGISQAREAAQLLPPQRVRKVGATAAPVGWAKGTVILGREIWISARISQITSTNIRGKKGHWIQEWR